MESERWFNQPTVGSWWFMLINVYSSRHPPNFIVGPFLFLQKKPINTRFMPLKIHHQVRIETWQMMMFLYPVWANFKNPYDICLVHGKPCWIAYEIMKYSPYNLLGFHPLYNPNSQVLATHHGHLKMYKNGRGYTQVKGEGFLRDVVKSLVSNCWNHGWGSFWLGNS